MQRFWSVVRGTKTAAKSRLLLLVLPSACLQNSRYMKYGRLTAILRSLGLPPADLAREGGDDDDEHDDAHGERQRANDERVYDQRCAVMNTEEAVGSGWTGQHSSDQQHS